MKPSESEIEVRYRAVVEAAEQWRDPEYEKRAALVNKTLEAENAFTEEAVAFAINQQTALLTRQNLEAWIGGRRPDEAMIVGVLNAGNIPMVGLQDFLAVVLTGHSYLGTVSSKSPELLPGFVGDVAAKCTSLDAEFADADELFTSSNAVIATGSDETAGWVREQCEAYGIPEQRRLLRGHRFAVAVLDGTESDEDYERLAEDVLLHEGLGCRNVALIWAPVGLEPDPMLDAMAQFRGVFPAHETTRRRLKMPQAFLEALGAPHAYGEGMEFLISKGEPEIQQPGHVRWVEYADPADVRSWLDENAALVQLVVARDQASERIGTSVPVERHGHAQRPALDWRPDGVDTVDFLVNLR